jgi:hypothetical protein
VLATGRDDRLAALRAGEACSAVLPAATNLGLATTPLALIRSRPAAGSGPDRASIREHIVGLQLFPQLVLRVGGLSPARRTCCPRPAATSITSCCPPTDASPTQTQELLALDTPISRPTLKGRSALGGSLR